MNEAGVMDAGRQANLSQIAYEHLEAAIVSCVLPPGQFLSVLDLQAITGVGRTPTHLAVTKLAADTLITIRPRHGLQITAIDLKRERTLLDLRRNLEQFVVRLAIERATAAQRDVLEGLCASLCAIGDADPVGSFNRLDLQLNRTLLDACCEPFLQHSLRPLHTMSRRVGWLYHSVVQPTDGIKQTRDCHLAILQAVIARRRRAALVATDRLVGLSRAMFDALAQAADPRLFDCNRVAQASPTRATRTASAYWSLSNP